MEEKITVRSLWLKARRNFNKSGVSGARKGIIFGITFAIISSILPIQTFDKQTVAFAATQGELNNTMSNLKKEMDNLQSHLNQKRNEKATLENEVAIFDGQIRQLELQIEATNLDIAITVEEMDKANKEIARLREEIKAQKEFLKENVRVLYEEGQVSAVEVVASSENFSEFLDRNEYLVTIHGKINTVIEKVNALRREVENKKKLLEEKKKSLDNLRKQQGGQKADLDNQRAAKANLLAQVANSEANYKAMIDSKAAAYRQAQDELSRIMAKAAPTGRRASQGNVRRGDIIGYQGNTGYSFGSHLHFGVYMGSQDVDPMSYLNSGRIGWPLASYTITQGFWGGFSHRGVGWPGGLDLVHYHGAPVYAAADGNIIYNGNSGPFGHHVIIAHANGLRTLYAHLQ